MTARTAELTIASSARTPSAKASGVTIAVISALAFSSSGPVMKPLLEAGWTVGAALLLRMSIAGLVLAPALVIAIRRQRGFLRRHGLIIAAFGLTGVVGCQVFFFSAMQRMPVGIALLIQYLAPVLLVALAWVRTRRAPSRLVLGGSLVAIVGLVLVVDIAGAQFDLLGVLFALGAAVCMAAYFVIAARTGDSLPPLALASGGLLTGAALLAALCAIGVLPFAAPDVTIVLGDMQLAWWVPVVWVGAVATTIGYALGVIAAPRIGSRVASFVGLSEVLFALGFAWLLLGEAPSGVQFIGGALILLGVILVKMDDDSASSLPEPDLPALTAPVEQRP